MSEMSDFIDHESACIRSNAAIAEEQRQTNLSRPSYMLRPRLMIDGDKWCALFGENIQDGVAGFGDSPEAAYADFDRAWKESLPPMPRKKSETSQAEIAKLTKASLKLLEACKELLDIVSNNQLIFYY